MEDDTIKLLRECSAGLKIGISSIDDVLDNVENGSLKDILKDSRDIHCRLDAETDGYLERYHDEGKEPHPVAKGMSWMKTNMKMAMEETDHTIADLITDGCNMGVKSLSRYLNQYAAADEQSKDITKKLIRIEEDLAVKMRDYL